jgi:dolichyl-phosphate-mannose--protein O-mannosyl transferase
MERFSRQAALARQGLIATPGSPADRRREPGSPPPFGPGDSTPVVGGGAPPGGDATTDDLPAPADLSVPDDLFVPDDLVVPDDPPAPSWSGYTLAPDPLPRPSLLARFEHFVDAPRAHAAPAAVIDQLRSTLPPDRLIGWLVTLVITGLAFVIRLVNVGQPAQIMFDETYYAKDAWSLLQYGYEAGWVGEGADVDPMVATGNDSALSSIPFGEETGYWPVHPPVGKWLIAAGQAMFGLNPFGWRFMAVVFGSLMVLVVIRLARRLAHSTLIGGLAGLLLTVDGLSFVMSRLALLDIFQAFFIVAGVACVVADRDFFRNHLADHLATRPDQTLAGRTGPFVFRPWLIAAGVLFGLGCATKWNTVFVVAVFGILVVVWSWSARALAGARRRAWWALLKDGVPGFVSLVVLGAGVYLASWIPYLLTTGGHGRQWGAQHPDDPVVRRLGPALGSLWHEHVETYRFHTGEQMANATHAYASSPWGWPVVARTVGVYAENDIAPGVQGCPAPAGSTCMRVITALGTPLLWWAATVALLAGLVWWLAGRDWRFGVVVVGFASTWLPWVFSNRGAMFSFYAITMIPFMVIGLAMALGLILGPARPGVRRQTGAVLVGTLVALIVLNFAFMYPLYTAQLLTHQQWSWRIWLPGWS